MIPIFIGFSEEDTLNEPPIQTKLAFGGVIGGGVAVAGAIIGFVGYRMSKKIDNEALLDEDEEDGEELDEV